MHRNTRDAHIQEKIKKREKNKDHVAVMNPSQQLHSNHHLRQHPNYKRVSPKTTSLGTEN
jgi:hypothetical protein